MKSSVFSFQSSAFLIFSALLLVYMLWPMPSNISEFKALPDSVKSTLSGDTIQVPNVAGYFSDNYRDFIVPFYQQDFQRLSLLPLSPYRLSYPPEYSFVAIKKHTDTTYLEEVVYPLKGSLFINGFEPFNPDGTPKYWGANPFNEQGKVLYTKTTIRYYPSSAGVRFIVWFGIVASLLFLYKLSRKIIF